METRINYVAVGLFVIVLSVALIGVGIWLGTDITGREYQRYSIYFDESVSGLSRNASVTHQGVEVGRVAELRLIPERPGVVHVIVEIEPRAPLREDTLAILRMQGLTGIAEIELQGGSPAAPPPQQPAREPYPVLASGPSLMAQLESALASGLETLDELASNVNRLLAPENVDAVSATLRNLERFTAVLADNRDTLERSLAHAERLLASGADAGEQLGPVLEDVQRSLATFDRMGESLRAAGDELGQLAQESRVGVTRFARGSLPQLERTMEEVHHLANNLARLAEELSEEPEMLIFGRRPQPRGPGE